MPTTPAPTESANSSSTDTPRAQTFEATVESVVVRDMGNNTKVTFASLKSGGKTMYAAWKNSYFARDIAVHRKYNFTGAFTSTKRMTYMADPIFTDIPVVSKYLDFSLLKPGEHHSQQRWSMVTLVLLVIAIPAVALTVLFNSAYVEQRVAQRSIVSANIEVEQ